ncbi:MAG: response regulator [Verrucomicrobiae bacterium]|nr:response regulator [Verrucomicrobiae bacterium]MDW8344939.1 response regulator [Verrucomicrobiae bacterium]
MQRTFDILLVEDNPADVEITREAFRRTRAGVRLHVCRDGEEAVEYLQQRGRYQPSTAPRPDLILLDLNLPGKSGLEVLRDIKQAAELKCIPVVVLTTSDRDEDILRSYECGTNSYLTKPVQFDDCVKLVAEIQEYWLQLSKLPPR